MSEKPKAKSKSKDWKAVLDKDQEKPKKEKKKAAPKGLEHPEYLELEAKLNEAEEKANEYLDKSLRVQAEMENLRRRSEIDVANAHKYALEKFVLELLPIIDSLERGMEACGEDNDVVKNIHHGMELTHEMFLKVLQKFNVDVESPEGKDFDHNKHQAMSIQEDKGVKPNTVLKVVQKGYLLNKRLIRPALVIVSKA